jgi:hypothetical protein
MTVTLEHVTRSVDGMATIRNVSPLGTTHEAVAATQNETSKRRYLETRTSMLTLR